MKKICIIFSVIVMPTVFALAQSNGRQVVSKDFEFFYQKTIELENEDILLFPYCWTCNELVIDKIDKRGQYLETYTLPVLDYEYIIYLGESIPYNGNGIINALLRGNRNDSLFILNTTVDLENLTIGLLDEFFVTNNSTTNVFFSDTKKITDKTYLVTGLSTINGGASAKDYIFIKTREDGKVYDFQVIERGTNALTPLLSIGDMDVINSNRILVTSRGGAGMIIDSTYTPIYTFGFFAFDESYQNLLYSGLGYDFDLKGDTVYFSVLGSPSNNNSQLISQYIYLEEEDSLQYIDFVEVENPTLAEITLGFFGNMDASSNGDLMVGGLETFDPFSGASGYSNHIYMAKYSSSLEPIWYKRFGGDFYHDSYNLYALSNGNALIYGNVYNYFGMSKRQGFYILVDSEGEVLASTHPVYELEDLSVFPNPVAEKLRYRLPSEAINYDIVLYDMEGRILYNQENTSRNNIDVQSFPSGQYLLQLRDKKERKIYQAKFQKL